MFVSPFNRFYAGAKNELQELFVRLEKMVERLSVWKKWWNVCPFGKNGGTFFTLERTKGALANEGAETSEKLSEKQGATFCRLGMGVIYPYGSATHLLAALFRQFLSAQPGWFPG
ncbi:MAG: hypothetical protein ACOYYS_00110 [Chloroflexota bacterium]